MKKPVVEYQHFIIKNQTTGELKQFKIGPVPIPAIEMLNRVKKAHRQLGIPFSKNNGWIIEKAWVGPEVKS